MYLQVNSQLFTENVIEGNMDYKSKTKVFLGKNKKLSNTGQSSICFPDDLSKSFKYVVQRKYLGQNASLNFKAKAKIQIYSLVKGADFDAQAYNGKGVKSLLSNWLKDWSSYDIEVKDNHVIIPLSGTLTFNNLMI